MSRPEGDAILATVQATADRLAFPVGTTKGAVVMQAGRGLRTTHFTPGQPVTLTSYDNHVSVTIPGDAASVPLTVTHSFDPQPGESAPPNQAGFWQGFSTSYLDAWEQNGAEFHQFSRPITITMAYAPQQAQALGLPEPDLTLFWFDPSRYDNAGGWVPVPSTVDSTNHVVTAAVTHLSNWQLSDGSSPSDAFIPSLQAGQVDLFKGSFSYNYPIDVPAGPGGVKPYLSLNYYSDESDTRKGERPLLQSGWAGKGWSLSPSYIALDKLDPSSNYSRFYPLILNGQSFDLMRGACLSTCGSGSEANPSLWEWHSTDESFMKVRAQVNNATPPTPRGGTKNGVAYARYKWQLWTKDGTRYDFEEDAWQGWFAPDGYDSSYSYLETYKWYLNRVEDTHGNRITYTYGDGTNGNGRLWGSCDSNGANVHGTVQQDVWPTKISWGSRDGVTDRYEILFDSTSRGTLDASADVPNNMCGPAPQQTRQLRNITVLTNHSNPYNSNTWDQVRKYGLVYRDDPSDPHSGDQNYYLLSDNALQTGCNPNCTYLPDYTTKKLTLLKITEWGSSTFALPPTTFEYNYAPTRGTGFFPGLNSGWNRMAYVDNGKGGAYSYSTRT